MLKTGLITALIATIIDQAHKSWMLFAYEMPKKFAEQGSIEVTSFFNHVMVWNCGVSFGIFGGGCNDTQRYSLVALYIVVVAFLIFWLKKTQSKFESYAIGLVIGGAVGNGIDRIWHGAVADFFDFHINNFHWPAFNLADSFIFIGVFMLVTEPLFVKKKGNE